MRRGTPLSILVLALALAAEARADEAPGRQPTLVYTSRIVLRLDTREGLAQVKHLAESLDGRLVSANDSALALEVPRERYEDLVRRLGELGWLRSEQISTEDVTDALTEHASDAAAAEKNRTQLGRVSNLAQGTDERLLVERELEETTNAITSDQAAARELEHRAAAVHVAITLELPEVEPIPTPLLPFPWLAGLGLERLQDTEPPAPQPHRVLRSFFDFGAELRLAHMAHPTALDGVSKSGAAALSFRALGEANPVGFFGGMDLVLGASRGFVYGTQLLGGIGAPIGRRVALGLATGPGFDGITSVIPFGVHAPLELYLSLDVAAPFAASAWVRDSWVFGASARRHGSSHAPFGDELAAGLDLAFGSRDEGSYTGRRSGPLVGFGYREAMGAEIYEIRLGWGAHESDFSESY